MSQEDNQATKKSAIERVTKTTIQVGAFVAALTVLLTQVPPFTKAVHGLYCEVFSCNATPDAPGTPVVDKPAEVGAPPIPAAPASPPVPGSLTDKLQALQNAGIDLRHAKTEWFSNPYTPYPFLVDPLLTLLQGKRLRPCVGGSDPCVEIGVIAPTYEYRTGRELRSDTVDLQTLKAAVLDSYNNANGTSESDFDRLLQ
ncbi:hypothetical protein ACUSIJ_21855 [Pseudochelatococcus sp. B33]